MDALPTHIQGQRFRTDDTEMGNFDLQDEERSHTRRPRQDISMLFGDIERPRRRYTITTHDVEQPARPQHDSHDRRARRPRNTEGRNPLHIRAPRETIWKQVEERNYSGNYNFERFESMQLLNLCIMQYEIRKLSNDIFEVMHEGGEDEFPYDQLESRIESLKPMLKNYNEALIQLHEIMSYPKAKFNTIGKYDQTSVAKVPMLMANLRGDLEQDGVRRTIEKLIPKALRESNLLSIGPRRELNENWVNPPEYTRARAEEHEKEGLSRIVDNLARFAVAFFGGASLLVPMIIMVFSNSRNANLIITSAFVLFFAIVLSIGSKASNQEILGATAGYAAVLVVFIGTSGAGSS